MRHLRPDDAEAYRALARCWAATVTVVTAKQRPGTLPAGVSELDGFTATGFLTVSIAPPIILVSAMRDQTSEAMLRDPAGFAVNLLSPNQDALAAEFARTHAERPDIWASTPWTADDTGAPLLHGTAGAFSARVRQRLDAGDHILVLGDVTAIHLNVTGEAETLVYHNRGYGHFRRAKT